MPFYIPDGVTLQTPNTYIHPGLTTGDNDGTSAANAYQSFQAFIDDIGVGRTITAGDVIGFKTGTSEVITSSVTTTKTLVQISDLASSVTLTAYGDKSSPMCELSHYVTSTSADDWIEVSLSASGTVGSLNASPGSKLWAHQTADIQMSGVVASSIDYMTSIVNASNFKSHSYTASAVGTSWNIGTAGGTYGNYQPQVELQFRSTTDGLFIYCDQNPVTKYGQIIMMAVFDTLFKYTNTDLVFNWAFAQIACGRGLAVVNNGATEKSITVDGLRGKYGAYLIHINTDNTIGGGAGQASIWQPKSTIDEYDDITTPAIIGTVIADDNEPWINGTINDVYAEYMNSVVIYATGWIRNLTISNSDIRFAPLQVGAGSVFFLGEAYADYGEHNLVRDCKFTYCVSGIGEFASSDSAAIDLDGNTSSWWIRDCEFYVCYTAVQLSGGRRNQKVYRCVMYDVVKGIDIADGTRVGESETDVDNVTMYLGDYSEWDVSAVQSEVNGWGVKVGSSVGYEPMGPLQDARNGSFTKNLAQRFRNLLIVGLSASDTVAIANRTVGGAGAFGTLGSPGNAGPYACWDTGGGTHVAQNGADPIVTVPNYDPGARNGVWNSQQRVELTMTISGLHVYNIGTTRILIDEDDNDLIDDVTHGLTLDADYFVSDPLLRSPGVNGDFRPTSSSPTSVKTGGTVLDADNEGPDISYTQPGANLVDLRQFPRITSAWIGAHSQPLSLSARSGTSTLPLAGLY